MFKACLFKIFLVITSLGLSLAPLEAQQDRRPQSESSSKTTTSPSGFHGIGVAFNTSTLGLGGSVAVPLGTRVNVRFGFHAFNYGRDFEKDGINYHGTLNLRSINALVDLFPFGGGLHVSPGALIYNGNELNADALVGNGDSFDLGNATYFSSATDPVRGKGKLTLNKAAPIVLFGFGNMVPRTGKRLTFSFDAGVVFQGTPDVTLNFTGTACQAGGVNCVNATTNPTFLSHVATEQRKLQDEATPFKYYPVVQMGIGYRFGGSR